MYCQITKFRSKYLKNKSTNIFYSKDTNQKMVPSKTHCEVYYSVR